MSPERRPSFKEPTPPRLIRSISWARCLMGVLIAAIVALACLPILALIWVAINSNQDSWPHLFEYVLPASLIDTVGLLILVALGSGIIGVGTAWLTALCQFPGRRFFTWALMLPLAIPTYIAAYCMVEIFDFTGPIQSSIRSVGGFSSAREYWFPDIRSIGGAALVMTLVLYPYVYLTTRLMFSMQGASVLEVSRSLGSSSTRMFWNVALPLVRPALAAGIALVLMETLNDIGAVEYLGVRTTTFAVFETWLNRDDLGGAVQLAVVTLVIIALLVWMERRSHSNRNFAASSREKPTALLALSNAKQALAWLACASVLLGGFGVPVYVLMGYAIKRVDQFTDPQLWSSLYNSFQVSFLTGLVTITVAFSILLVSRISGLRQLKAIGRIASLGYAIPGTILAIGLLIPIASFDNWLDAGLRETFGISSGLLLSGSIFILIYAYSLRFLAIAWATLDSGFVRVSQHVDMAGRGLGRSPWRLAGEVHLPIMRHALGAAFLLVFVDTTKELSATLLLRPFGFQTLATMIYDKASQSAVEEAAVAALTLIALGLIPVMLLIRSNQNSSNKAKKTRASGPR